MHHNNETQVLIFEKEEVALLENDPSLSNHLYIII